MAVQIPINRHISFDGRTISNGPARVRELVGDRTAQSGDTR
jgi:hypothetical protein